MEARGQAGRLSAGALGRALLPTLVLAAAGLFAYAALIGYHPNAGFETVPDETEAFFFEPGSSPLLIVLTTLWILFNRRYQIRDAYMKGNEETRAAMREAPQRIDVTKDGAAVIKPPMVAVEIVEEHALEALRE